MNRRRILTFSFLAVALGVWAYLALPIDNYIHYYSALDQLAVDVHSMSVSSWESNVTVSLQFQVSNPTPYEGLQFHSLAYQALLPNGSSTNVNGVGYGGLSGSGSTNVIGVGYAGLSGPGPLSPHSSIYVSSEFVLTGLGMSHFKQLCEASQHTLSWSIQGSLGLGTRDGVLVDQFQIPVTTRC